MSVTDDRGGADSRRILAGIQWSYLGGMMRMASQLGIAAVLARILSPADFGLVALGMVAVKFARYFADLGMTGAVIQKQQLSESEIGAAFAISVLLGAVFCLGLIGGARPLADFYGNPDLVGIIRWLSSAFLIAGFSNTSVALLRRSLRFKYLSLSEALAYVLGYGVVGIGMALWGFGPYSLVGAFTAQSLALLVMAYARTRHTLVIPRHHHAYSALASYGSQYSIATFLSFLSANLDYMVIGKYFSPALLGAYNRGRYLVSLPTYQLLISVTQVLFPSYAAHQQDPAKLKTLYMNGMLLTGLILMPLGFGMIPAAPQIVAVLLGSQWSESILILQICAIFAPVEMMTSIAATLCSATNRLRNHVMVQLFTLLLLVPLLVWISKSGSIYHAAAAMALVYWVRFFIYTYVITGVLGTRWRDHLLLHLPHLAATLLVSGAIYGVTKILAPVGDFPMLLVQMGTGALVMVLFILYAPFPEVRRSVLQVVRRSGLVGRGRGVVGWLMTEMAKSC